MLVYLFQHLDLQFVKVFHASVTRPRGEGDTANTKMNHRTVI